jgi:diacylglycerol O-acyltransferase
MTTKTWSRLSPMDASFIWFENADTHMHVASVQIHEAGPLRLSDGRLDFDRIREYVESRLHMIPRYRQRLLFSPVPGELIWIDDERFNIDYHIRHSRLPEPGNLRQLKRTAARILSQQLDRGKPLWEMWVIEGLDDDRFAVVSKVHHCMVDGVAGSELLSVLMTPEPTHKIEPPPVWKAQSAPSRAQLMLDQAGSLLAAPVRVAEWLRDLATDRNQAQQQLAEQLRALGRMARDGMVPASNTPINQPIGSHRRFDWVKIDLDRNPRINRVAEASVNEVVMANVAGAMRRYLERSRDTQVDGLDFRVLAPVSVRKDSEHGEMGNHVSAWIVPMPIGEPDPLERLRQIHETTVVLKRTRQATGAEVLTQAMSWTGSALLSQGSQLMAYGQPFNMVVTNVPGPPVPFFLLESRVLEVIPMVPLMGTLATGIALFSYDGVLHWGVTGDWELVPDLHDVVLALEHSYAEMLEAVDGLEVSAAAS